MTIKGRLVKVTPPAAEPLTLDEVKRHLRVDSADEDLHLEQLIQAAREYCEEITGRAFIRQGLQFYPDEPYARKIHLPRAPLISVDAIEFFFDDGSTVQVDTAAYLVDSISEPGLVCLKTDYDWPEEPETHLREVNPVCITYTSGYGSDGSSVPQRLRQAMYLLIGHWWENREDTVQSGIVMNIPTGVHQLLQLERLFW